jgi:hypothetical protein
MGAELISAMAPYDITPRESGNRVSCGIRCLEEGEMGEDGPRHDLVVVILWTRMNIDAKCERSPVFPMQPLQWGCIRLSGVY